MQLKPIAMAALAALSLSAQAATGPSSSASPYVTPTAAGYEVTSIISVGDAAANGYRMVGIPDGLGAYDNGNGTFTVLMNHELGATAGIQRAHGTTGAFVSEWVINKSNLSVVSGADLATRHYVSNGAGGWTQSTSSSFARLCSADLANVSAFYNASSGNGTMARLFMNGEETGNEGRAYAFVATGSDKGSAYELPALGKFSWENSVANPYARGDQTIVIGTDDSTPGQVYVYKGTKTNVGNDVQKAGLTNGTLRGIKVNDGNAQGGTTGNLERGTLNNASFSTVAIDTSVTGAAQQTNARASGVTEFARPEDGAWADEKTFYFVTTGADPDGSGPVGTQSARLKKVSFAENPDGSIDYDNGTISDVLDSVSLTGTDGAAARSFDNLTVDGEGNVIIQEDPGNNAYIAKTWKFDPRTGVSVQILESDRTRFSTGGLTIDEESSGVIDITDVLGRNDGKRYYLADMQAHYGISGELVEGGQLYLVTAVPEVQSYAAMVAGLGLVGAVARRSRRK